jgi:HPt (histidine-containing phosphotransfer) domain-containing protein
MVDRLCVTFAAIADTLVPYDRRVVEPVMPDLTLSPPAAGTAVLDEAALQRLRELDPDGENQVVERVLRAYEASLQRLLPQAVRAMTEGDHDGVRHVVHTLKSSSASVGALELSRRCSELENRLRAVQFDRLEPLVVGLEAEGRRVLAAVQAALAA